VISQSGSVCIAIALRTCGGFGISLSVRAGATEAVNRTVDFIWNILIDDPRPSRSPPSTETVRRARSAYVGPRLGPGGGRRGKPIVWLKVGDGPRRHERGDHPGHTGGLRRARHGVFSEVWRAAPVRFEVNDLDEDDRGDSVPPPPPCQGQHWPGAGRASRSSPLGRAGRASLSTTRPPFGLRSSAAPEGPGEYRGRGRSSAASTGDGKPRSIRGNGKLTPVQPASFFFFFATRWSVVAKERGGALAAVVYCAHDTSN